MSVRRLVAFFSNRCVLFCWACVTGIVFALVWRQYELSFQTTFHYYRVSPSDFDYQAVYRRFLHHLNFKSLPTWISYLQSDSSAKPANAPSISTEAEWLYHQIPVLCIILTTKPKNAAAVSNTWSSHCNRALFYGTYNDDKIPVNKLPKGDSKWEQTCQALTRAWLGYASDGFKWVVIADDHTFVVVENLRYMVAGLNAPNDTYYLGHPFKDFDGQYNLADAGVVINWNALLALMTRIVPSSSPTPILLPPPANADSTDSVITSWCRRPESWKAGDKTLGKLLESAGIKPRDTRDLRERARFIPLHVHKLLIPGTVSAFNRYWRDSVYISAEGSDCCSDFAITFHDITADRMYMMEYVLYHLKPVSRTWPRPKAPVLTGNKEYSWRGKPRGGVTAKPEKTPAKSSVKEISIAKKANKKSKPGSRDIKSVPKHDEAPPMEEAFIGMADIAKALREESDDAAQALPDEPSVKEEKVLDEVSAFLAGQVPSKEKT